MQFVYILSSLSYHGRIYIGITENLENRVRRHNAGDSKYTKSYAPWKIETYVGFSNKQLAQDFEKYLKNGSGFAFLKRHFLTKTYSENDPSI